METPKSVKMFIAETCCSDDGRHQNDSSDLVCNIYVHVSFWPALYCASKPVSRATLEWHGDVIRAIQIRSYTTTNCVSKY